MPDETRFKAVPSIVLIGIWFAWFLDKPGGGLFLRTAPCPRGLRIRYASESEALDAAKLAYWHASPSGGFQMELPL